MKNRFGVSGKENCYNTDDELVSALARELNKSPAEIKVFLSVFGKTVRQLVKTNMALTIRGFGTWFLKQKRKSRFRNVATEQLDHILLTYSIKFQSANCWRNEINAEIKDIMVRKRAEQVELKRNTVTF